MNKSENTSRTNIPDQAFRLLSMAGAISIIIIMLAIATVLLVNSLPSIKEFGWRFLWDNTWNPVAGEFGAASTIYGTLVSTIIAMLIAAPMGVIIALFLVELSHPILAKFVGGAIELLAAIPSIIYGMWGLFVFVPIMQTVVEPWLSRNFGNWPIFNVLFSGPPIGIGMLTAGIILALMILPFITAVSRDVLN
ncbi:phosphate ABC transporter permease subunit PstC, partial [bacterium]|nr:phosphate ABC transporter permease subunit PstC [bacterium]